VALKPQFPYEYHNQMTLTYMYISGQKYVMMFEHICLKKVKNLADDKVQSQFDYDLED
jgi:hypothetical protein